MHKRWVLLIDLDLFNGDAALQLDAAPSHALAEAIEHPDHVDELFLERGVIHVTARLDLLASLEPLDGRVDVEESGLLSILQILLLRYRFVFIDVPASTCAAAHPCAASAEPLHPGEQRKPGRRT